MKRLIAVFLCLVLLLLPMAGCKSEGSSSSGAAAPQGGTPKPGDAQNAGNEEPDDGGDAPVLHIPGSPDDPEILGQRSWDGGGSWDSRPNTSTAEPGVYVPSGVKLQSYGKEIAYVLIYNPYLYDEDLNSSGLDLNESLSTGSFGTQIDPDMHRGDGLEQEPEFLPWDQNSILQDIDEMNLDLSGDRAGTFQKTYRVGDREDFYHHDENMASVVSDSFDCLYSGDHCVVWSLNGAITSADAQAVGEAFDEEIYPFDVEHYGEPRYAEDGGKVHILYHPFTRSVLGYFYSRDMYSSGEVTPAQAEQYKLNLNKSIIHINSKHKYSENVDVCNGTLAHEFQHLINATDAFYTITGEWSKTWINEAMSGDAEEWLSPGTKEANGHYGALNGSGLIRGGQSLYNFKTDTVYSFDIGVYGSVYLFSQFYKNLAGEDAFRKFHDYWRTCYTDTLDEAEALYEVMPDKWVQAIDKAYSYPSRLQIGNEKQTWMSKLVLHFYLSMLHFDSWDPECFGEVKVSSLLYDEINPAGIEGGGRLIVATKDGSYELPADADRGLIYIGLDSDFNPVTPLICP